MNATQTTLLMKAVPVIRKQGHVLVKLAGLANSAIMVCLHFHVLRYTYVIQGGKAKLSGS